LDVRDLAASFSPQGESLREIVRTIHSAKRRIDAAPFFISHTQLIDSLCFVASRQQIKVRCFVDPSSTAPAERHVLDKLSQHGVDVLVVHVTNGKMHLKCAVVDDDTVITGAANWTVRAFDRNVEDTLVIQSPSLAQAYRERLARLMPYVVPYYASHDAPSETVRTKPPADASSPTSKPPYAAPRLQRFRSIRSARVFFTADSHPDNGLAAADLLVSHIRSARKTIDVSMYLLVAPALIDALAQTAASGAVPVRILVDSGMLAGDSRPILDKLASAGAEIRWLGSEKFSMHLKAMVVDESRVWTGSANWSQAGFTHNVEDLLLFESADLARMYSRHFDALHAAATQFQPITPTDPATPVPANADGFPTGLPPSGPRTHWLAGLEDRATDDFSVPAHARYLADDEYLPVLLDLVANAHQSILVSMYVVGAPQNDQPHLDRLTAALIQAARRGVYVHLLLHMPQSETVTMNPIHLAWAEKLRPHGIDVRLHAPAISLHAKVVVVDLAKVLVGSHNWSEGALSGRKVLESSLLLVLPRQDRRLADYVLGRESIRDMRSPSLIQDELRILRQLDALSGKARTDFLAELEKRK
jgi:phosphatidylserine/phosphatidylglycerophosphate/cardiolipin synthase-like enzyme